jgi:hypothetical protein
MPSKHVEPTITAASFSCPHCGAHAHQTWYYVYAAKIIDNGKPSLPSADPAAVLAHALQAFSSISAKTDAATNFDPEKLHPQQLFLGPEVHQISCAPQIGNLYLSVCFSCKEIAAWLRQNLLFPPVKHGAEPNPDLPATILPDYEEARSILELSPRGAAALLRLCIQKLCKHLGEPGKSIDDDIASLVKKGLNVRVQQALDIVRVIGNESVHPGSIDLRDNREIAVSLFGLVNLITEKMISDPKHVAAMYAELPANKLRAIEKRDKGA